MRISDWSSDVCSSDLPRGQRGAGRGADPRGGGQGGERHPAAGAVRDAVFLPGPAAGPVRAGGAGGRASDACAPVEAGGRSSEEGGVGKGGVRTVRSRWAP